MDQKGVISCERLKRDDPLLKTKSKWGLTAGIAILCAAAALLFLFLGKASTPKYESILLLPTPEYETDWSYYDEAGNQAREVYKKDGYLDTIEGFSGKALAAERTMTESIPDAALTFQYMDAQISVYLDGKLLYSDIPDIPEEKIRFSPPTKQSFEEKSGVFQTQYVILPEDYAGKTLTVITYFPEGPFTVPVYPTIQNDDTIAAGPATNSIGPIVLAGAFAAVAFLLLSLLVYGLATGAPEWPTALLAAFFLCVSISQIYNSQAAYYSIEPNLAVYLVSTLYIDLLFLFFACYMRKGFRIALICAVVFYAVASCAQVIKNVSLGDFYETGNNGWVAFGIFALFIVFCCLEWKAGKSYFPAIGKCLLAFGAAYAAAILFSHLIAPESRFAVDLWMPFSSFFFGKANAVNEILSGYIAIVGTAVILVSFVRRNILIHTERNALTLRNEMMLENIRGMEDSLRVSDKQRHEMKHHIAAMQILLKNGDVCKAGEYLEKITEAVDEAGMQRYTENILVNAILNDEIKKAAACDIKTEADIVVPRELSLDDHDLCSLLYNMLDNAIDACARMPAGKKRWINFRIHKKGHFLIVLCRNSKSGSIVTGDGGYITTSKKNRAGHGYGLPVMREICEKYHSVLLVEFYEDSFTVKTNLRLPG